ncbi:unnamed protein product [Sphagnum jensenii]|uniref:NPF family transporter n=1 Tax=Sphagnum jensenii TaxID=128206 RepID=A0ABP0XHT3_9BRYO
MEELHEGGRRRAALLSTGAADDHKSNNVGHSSSSSSSSSCSSSPPPRHAGGAAAAATTTTAPDSQQQQQLNIVGDGSVDIHGKPSNKATSGRWKAAYFLMGTELLERTAFFGISLNLVTYLVTVLHQGTEQSISTVYNWSGTAWILPLLGGFIADAYWGRFWTITVFGVVYLLGLLLLTLTVSIRSLRPAQCASGAAAVANCEPGTASKVQVGVFYLALYVIALGIGGVKPCLSALGGDQFDEDDEEKLEKPMKRSFFNYWWLTVGGGGLISLTLLVYVQDHVAFGWGYGIPTVGFAVGLLIFFCGTPRYRLKRPSGSPLTQVAQVLVAAIRKFNVVVPSDALEFQESDVYQNTPPGKRNLVHTDTIRNRDTNHDDHVFKDQLDLQQEELAVNMNANPWWLCSITQVEEVKLLVRVIPVWFATLMFLIVVAQLSTFFLSQGNSMDLSMGPHFKIPAASLELFGSFTVLVAIPVYDLCFVPFVRRFTHNERGITMLQRMGIGLFISIFSMIAAALVEAKRLKVVHDHGLEDRPEETVPISVFWLIPQYSILALAQVFAYIGQLEFFYDQAPDNMQSVGTALFTSNTGVAQFLSTALLQVVVRATGRDGHGSWIVANLNLCRIDKFYWLLAVMSAVNLLFYIAVAKWYVYKKTRSVIAGSSLAIVVVAPAAEP